MSRWMQQALCGCVALLFLTGCATQREVVPSPSPPQVETAQVAAATPARPFPPREGWRIACVGDSITYGWGGDIDPVRESYPARLAERLGSSCVVSNFGLNGATTLDYPEHLWKQALEFKPDSVVIILGYNDAEAGFDQRREAFINRYLAFIREMRELESQPEIYVGLPIVAYNGERDRILRSQVIPALRDVAAQTGAGVINLHPLLKTRSHLAIDNIHPNQRGYELIAAAVHQRLLGGEVVADDGASPGVAPNEKGPRGFLKRVIETRSLY